ncbi:hypothetical protein HHI36_021208 [Cryptolaemus montrouzieri]|uniref:C2H2-type domain-containing protein n=1 Tax=Cryptolaemus montrouzieri TaxID=559131 RepID=A0ABD2MWY4_9CUCU
MSVTSCCVCFNDNATILLNTKDSNNDTITSKLESVVSEVQWKDSFSICPQCLRTLDIVIEFKNLCLRSSSFRIDHKDSQYESKRNFTLQEDSKEIIDFGGSEESIGVQDLEQNIVTCDICKIEVNSDEHLYVHNREIHESKRTYKSELLSLHSNNKSEVNETLSIEGEVQSDDRFKGTSSVFICFHCSKTYKSKLMLGKHIKLQHDNHKFKCTNCTSFFKTKVC